MGTIQFNKGANFFLLIIVVAFVVLFSQFSYSFSQGQNNRNVTVDTTVNITGSSPVVMAVRMGNPITLNAGGVTFVQCNVSIRDYNGFSDLSVLNATLFRSSSSEGAADDNNTHYTNVSCLNLSAEQGGFYQNYTCTFPVQYYALNGTWNCTARINDSINLKGFGTNNTSISPLYALNVTTLIDYGNISSGEYSDNQTATIINLGNTLINVSVLGYGSNINDNLSFVCDQGNLSLDSQHFSANSADNFGAKQVLNKSFQRINGLTINKTGNSSYSSNNTYWELYVDPVQIAFGRCNGSIIFQASAA
jgi:hypothetical protein